MYLFTYILDPNHFYLCEKSSFDLGLTESVEGRIKNYVEKNPKVYFGEIVPKVNDVSSLELTSNK